MILTEEMTDLSIPEIRNRINRQLLRRKEEKINAEEAKEDPKTTSLEPSANSATDCGIRAFVLHNQAIEHAFLLTAGPSPCSSAAGRIQIHQAAPKVRGAQARIVCASLCVMHSAIHPLSSTGSIIFVPLVASLRGTERDNGCCMSSRPLGDF